MAGLVSGFDAAAAFANPSMRVTTPLLVVKWLLCAALVQAPAAYLLATWHNHERVKDLWGESVGYPLAKYAWACPASSLAWALAVLARCHVGHDSLLFRLRLPATLAAHVAVLVIGLVLDLSTVFEDSPVCPVLAPRSCAQVAVPSHTAFVLLAGLFMESRLALLLAVLTGPALDLLTGGAFLRGVLLSGALVVLLRDHPRFHELAHKVPPVPPPSARGDRADDRLVRGRPATPVTPAPMFDITVEDIDAMPCSSEDDFFEDEDEDEDEDEEEKEKEEEQEVTID